MVLKLLADYPEDVLHRTPYYHYWKQIDLFKATPNEINLLNRINARHCYWSYTRQPFNSSTELVCVADFLPFLEHLLLHYSNDSARLAASAKKSVPSSAQTRVDATSQQQSIIERVLTSALSRELSSPSQPTKSTASSSVPSRETLSDTSPVTSQSVSASMHQQSLIGSSSIRPTNAADSSKRYFWILADDPLINIESSSSFPSKAWLKRFEYAATSSVVHSCPKEFNVIVCPTFLLDLANV